MDDITENELKDDLLTDLGVNEEEETVDNALSKFRLLSDNAIPIPTTIGKIFSEHFTEGLESLSEYHADWMNNIDEFKNMDNTNLSYPKENIVRTTIESLVDYTYMRNPTPEVSGVSDEGKEVASVIGKALSALVNKKSYPGINLRPKILKQILYAHFTNFGLLELEWQDEKGSIEQVLEINNKIKEAIKSEEDADEAGRLYALLDILQRELFIRKHIGITVKSLSPFSLIIDPDCEETDLSDAKWVMKRDVMKIDHIMAEYMNKDEQGKFFFKYDKSVEFSNKKSNTNDKASIAADIIKAVMPDVDDASAKLRVKDSLMVVWVYDKVAKLKYLYLEDNFDTPLWVYEDEMELSRFFPFFILAFSSPLGNILQKGEVAHYLPFQNEINRINKMSTKIRDRAFNKYVYNSSAIDSKEAERFLQFIETQSSSDKPEALGIKVKDSDKPLSELFEPVKVPTSQFTELFDKAGLTAALDRITRITDAMRGAQFRTNTNTTSVETYNEFANNRLEGLTDKIELTTEELFWAITEIIVSKMDTEQISKLLSPADLQKYKPLTVEEFNNNYNLTIAAGSIEKPTSTSKKNEAIQIIQMLGQFGAAAPKTVLSIVTKLLRSAFSKNLVSDEDLSTLKQEGDALMQSQQQAQQQPQQRPSK